MPRLHRVLPLLALLFASPLAAADSAPEAVALLDRAIAFQGPKEFAKPGAIGDITVRLQAEVWDHSKGSGEKQSLGITRFLTMDPERVRSEWKTTGGTDIYGFDSTERVAGRQYWFAHYSPGGEMTENRILPGDKYATDRQRIDDEKSETKYLLRFFFLANLKGEHAVFTVKPDESIDHFGLPVKTHVLHRVNEEPESTEPPLTVWFDADTYALLRARAEPKEKDQKTLTFSFRYDETIQPRVKGVLFPYKIETREKPAGAAEERLAGRATILENGIDFNTDLSPALFQRPR